MGGDKPDRQVPMGSVWRPSISDYVLFGSSGKRFPCLWKIIHFEYRRKTRYPLKVSTGTSHRVRQVRHLRRWQRTATETWTFSVSLRALLLVTTLKLRRKVPYVSLLEEMVWNCPCGDAFVNWMCPTRFKMALTRPQYGDVSLNFCIFLQSYYDYEFFVHFFCN